MANADIIKSTARLPLEMAIELIETEIDNNAGQVNLVELKRRCQLEAPEAEDILDHTIQVFIRGGFVRRQHAGPGQLSYVKTELWSNRNEVLVTLRAPTYRYRYRSPESRMRNKRQNAATTVTEAKCKLSGRSNHAGASPMKEWTEASPMKEWTDCNWKTTHEASPKAGDGVLLDDNGKVLVLVLTKRDIIEGNAPEVRGYHLVARAFDDNEGADTVMFWAPCRDKTLRDRWEAEHL